MRQEPLQVCDATSYCTSALYVSLAYTAQKAQKERKVYAVRHSQPCGMADGRR